jgi:hypothetical protein
MPVAISTTQLDVPNQIDVRRLCLERRYYVQLRDDVSVGNLRFGLLIIAARCLLNQLLHL